MKKLILAILGLIVWAILWNSLIKCTMDLAVLNRHPLKLRLMICSNRPDYTLAKEFGCKVRTMVAINE